MVGKITLMVELRWWKNHFDGGKITLMVGKITLMVEKSLWMNQWGKLGILIFILLPCEFI